MPLNNFKIIQIENNTDELIKSVMLPDNSIVLAFHSGNPVYEITNGKKVKLPKVNICGQLTHHKEYVREPGSNSTVIKFRPWEAGLAIDNLHELTNKNTACTDVFQSKEDFTFSDNINIPEQISNLFNSKDIDKSIFQSLIIIQQTKGQIRVDDLAYRVCNSKRNFERKFKAATGLTPKEYIKNTRFSYSVKLIQYSDNLTEVSYDCGYFDQSHFIHDFKEITSVTPENYAGVIKPVENWAMATKAYL